MIEALEAAWFLHLHLRKYPKLAESLYKDDRIPNTAATKRNEFLRTVKLVFMSESSSNISRYALVLRYVDESWRDADDEQTLAEIVENGGGTVKCASIASARLRSPAARRAFDERRAHRAELENSAILVPEALFKIEADEELVSILVKRGKDGKVQALGFRPTTDKAILGYQAFIPSGAKTK
ncbi:hypothetical protein [Oharaeibacter diazotrophicus]|uniref:hypothetical protein n=1 Tax=Oharaeibacter diazotrophicus TaxID=1920512 RepID=UPI000F835DDA|nr:hypothetical protein [Oharaeibacter diazotrophicus]